VTGPPAPPLSSLEDLAGKEIYVRTSSSYYESLVQLNESFKKDGKPPITLTPADENFEDEDLLEMVNAGLIPIIIVDSHKAEFWAQIFDHLTLHPDLAVNRGGEIGWAFRKNSPKLAKVINDFVKDHKIGTQFGNILFKRYLQNTKWVKNSTSEEEIKKFQMTLEFFKKYAGTYGFDWLMVTAQGYQESRLDQSLQSPVGALGVMQILPSTASDPNVDIPDIQVLENNVHAGVKYLRFMIDEYFKDSDMDIINRGLFAFASYNAGPAKIARLRKQAAKEGLDPNRWFYNVELVAAKEIGRETVQYVSNIYKYYVAYKLITEKQALKEEKKATNGPSQ
jgi:membrane-bound lytic murein transglycosylase MltF